MPPEPQSAPLIINAAITGMVPRRARVPHVPVTAAQIVADAVACHRAGATILHLHARDVDEEPVWERSAYEAFIPEIRRQCPGVVICVTTSGRTFPRLEQRADVLALEGDARPDMASLTLGSLNFRDGASVTTIETIHALAYRMASTGIKPELEIFDLGMAAMAGRLLADGLVAGPLYANVLLGNDNTAPADPRSLAALVDALPPGTVWAGAGLGRHQLAVNGMAIFAGGHVRTGLEDNPWWNAQTREPATNVGLVERVAAIAALAGRAVATPEQARAMLGLAPCGAAPRHEAHA